MKKKKKKSKSKAFLGYDFSTRIFLNFKMAEVIFFGLLVFCPSQCALHCPTYLMLNDLRFWNLWIFPMTECKYKRLQILSRHNTNFYVTKKKSFWFEHQNNIFYICGFSKNLAIINKNDNVTLFIQKSIYNIYFFSWLRSYSFW